MVSPYAVPLASSPSPSKRSGKSFKNAGLRVLSRKAHAGSGVGVEGASGGSLPLHTYSAAEARQLSLANRQKLALLKSKLGVEAAASALNADEEGWGDERVESSDWGGGAYQTSNPATNATVSLPSEDTVRLGTQD